AAGRNGVRIIVLARAAPADEAVLGALEAFDLGILEGGPVGRLVPEPPNVALGNFPDGHVFELGRTGMPGGSHDVSLFADLRRRAAAQAADCLYDRCY